MPEDLLVLTEFFIDTNLRVIYTLVSHIKRVKAIFEILLLD